MKDLVKYQPKPRKSDREKTVTSIMDTFLDDVPEVQHPIAPIVDEESKFKGKWCCNKDLGKFVAEIKK
jgi:hypothetical protein